MFLDPAGELAETDETNNLTLGTMIRVHDPAIRFVNPELPQATIGVDYEAGIFARSVALPVTISLVQGSLPEGLMLDPETAFIQGTASREGLWTFTVRATVQGSAYLDQEFILRVAPPTLPLAVVTRLLPGALRGAAYRADLVASGGTGDHGWTATSSIPEGLVLSPNGAISGAPVDTGEFTFRVEVTDVLGAKAEGDVTLFVLTPRQVVAIDPIELPPGTVGVPYCTDGIVRLTAQRGFPPQRWSIAAGGVPGLLLADDGVFCGTPARPGDFTLLARVSDRSGFHDRIRLFVTIDQGKELAVSTFTLPDTRVGEPYEAEIRAIRGDPPYMFGLSGGKLPPGLELAANGEIRGTATASGTFAFITFVRDSSDRRHPQALSIHVLPEDDDGGCGCSAARPHNTSLPQSALLLPLLLVCQLALRSFRSRISFKAVKAR
jgi:hypothetical protein